jgi:Rps23 Pro-64 3,4-dihydroxylase Tpa1-like proline 4-hydroxylase
MSSQDEIRSEKVKRVLQRRAFLDSSIPKNADTLVDFLRLFEVAGDRGREYKTATPFPHIVIDDFLPDASLRTILDSLPGLDDPNIQWGNLNASLKDGRPAQLQKYHLQNVLYMKPPVRQLIAEMNSGVFTFLLAHLTGIDDLVVDAQMLGGGVHLVKPGGLLRVHSDFRRHLSYNLERRLNLLLYLNEDWKEEYGGHLELWDARMESCVHRILPVVNRCVIFNTTEKSFHGHPRPLTCPAGVLRRSIALYYYTVQRPEEVDPRKHATAWQDLPEERPSES